MIFVTQHGIIIDRLIGSHWPCCCCCWCCCCFNYWSILDIECYINITRWLDSSSLNAHHNECCHHSPPYNVTTLLLTILCAVHFISMTYLSYTWKFVPFNTLSPTHLLSGNHQFSIFESLLVFQLFCLFICFSLDSTYKWNYMVFVLLWHITLSITSSRSIHIVTNGKVSFFFISE